MTDHGPRVSARRARLTWLGIGLAILAYELSAVTIDTRLLADDYAEASVLVARLPAILAVAQRALAAGSQRRVLLPALLYIGFNIVAWALHGRISDFLADIARTKPILVVLLRHGSGSLCFFLRGYDNELSD